MVNLAGSSGDRGIVTKVRVGELVVVYEVRCTELAERFQQAEPRCSLGPMSLDH